MFCPTEAGEYQQLAAGPESPDGNHNDDKDTRVKTDIMSPHQQSNKPWVKAVDVSMDTRVESRVRMYRVRLSMASVV